MKLWYVFTLPLSGHPERSAEKSNGENNPSPFGILRRLRQAEGER